MPDQVETERKLKPTVELSFLHICTSVAPAIYPFAVVRRYAVRVILGKLRGNSSREKSA
jgi:hypothetical protein